jgi:hypothetical protein
MISIMFYYNELFLFIYILMNYIQISFLEYIQYSNKGIP